MRPVYVDAMTIIGTRKAAEAAARVEAEKRERDRLQAIKDAELAKQAADLEAARKAAEAQSDPLTPTQ